MLFPNMASTVTVGALVGWMLALTLKHVIADFLLQTHWMAAGKDSKTGWAAPLLVHCLIHGVLTTALVAALAPRWWYLGLVDFAIHLVLDRAKGFCVAHFDVTPTHRWFWWLIGIDQSLHHLTGFGLAILLAANP
ncbi:MAG TPA: DUF3307 domain-containing protein [Xanthobacteraceae bacterium]|nr:DUF3307 domain-containing protein [Xanthobacteraceae bacterium]